MLRSRARQSWIGAVIFRSGANIHTKDSRGAPLISKAKTIGMAKLLIEKGALLQSGGWLPLHDVVCFGRDPELIRLYREYGADPCQIDNHGKTPLMLLATLCELRDIKTLLLAAECLTDDAISHRKKYRMFKTRDKWGDDVFSIIELQLKRSSSQYAKCRVDSFKKFLLPKMRRLELLNSALMSEDAKCAICFDPLKEDDIEIAPCEHLFHKDCLEDSKSYWMRNSCAVCFKALS